MMCDDARLLLHAYLDNELDAAQSVAIDRHMQTCAACAALHTDYARLRQGFARASLYRRAPATLRNTWATEPHAQHATQVRRRPPVALAIAAGFIAALIVAAPAWWYTLHRDTSQTTVDEVVSSHIRSMQPQHLMDVVSTDQHTVKPWFDGKLDFSPRVKDLADQGFPLAGGRLDVLDGHSVAALVYRRHLHVINLYQWPASASATAPNVTQWHGYAVIQWTDERMRFVAVSDISEDELRHFMLAFQDDATSSLMR
jgi:anti-sigma factor RsiW